MIENKARTVAPKVNCPTCKKTVTWIAENEYRPFCCRRCQAIDFGEWASESYRIADKPSLTELDELELDQYAEEQARESENWLN